MKKYYLIICSILSASMIFAQTSTDALRYSNFDVAGTARTIGIGGGIGALGADFTTVSTNPAGLAMYRTSEFIITPSLYISSAESKLENGVIGANEESKTKFNLSNVAYIIGARPASVGSKWTTANIAVGLNQIANFNQTFFYRGVTEGSYNDRFLELAYDENGNAILPDNLDQFEAGLAFNTGAIYDPDGDYNNGVQWINDFQNTRDVEVYKEQLVKTSGAINELNFSLAGNYNERVMFGASVGLPFVNFKEEKTYIEEDSSNEIDAFEEMTFKEELSTSGIGINLKLGLIFRINQMFRLGAAVHTPTSYTLTDNFSTDMNYIFDIGGGPESFSAQSPAGTFEYKLKSPWRYIGSLGIIVAKKGFITAEAEFVNYSGAKFNFTVNSSDPGDAAYEEEVNGDIDNDFASALNIKVGGEYAYEIFRFRAGYGIYGTPYAGNIGTNNSAFSLGAGMRLESFYLDLAFRRLLIDEGYIPYRMSDIEQQQLVNNAFNKDRIVLTLGFKF